MECILDLVNDMEVDQCNDLQSHKTKWRFIDLIAILSKMKILFKITHNSLNDIKNLLAFKNKKSLTLKEISEIEIIVNQKDIDASENLDKNKPKPQKLEILGYRNWIVLDLKNEVHTNALKILKGYTLPIIKKYSVYSVPEESEDLKELLIYSIPMYQPEFVFNLVPDK